MLPLIALLVASPTKDVSGIVWIHDDWQKAKKQAIAKNQLVAIDVWATWCHTCISMQNYVMTEKPLSKVSSNITWLALDYDKEINAPILSKLTIPAIPSYFVVDPKTEQMVARWIGSGTAEEMTAFFSEATKSSEDSLRRGQLALGRKDYQGARQIFEGALKKEQLDRPTKGRMLNGLVEALSQLDPAACARQLTPYLDDVDDSTQSLDAIAMMVDCTSSLKDAAEKKGILTKLAKRLETALANPAVKMADDDRSAYLGSLIDVHDQLGDQARAQELVKTRIALLERAAKDAKTAEARTTFDWHRMECYLRLGRHDDAIAMLTASEKAQPKDFNHPWRLANVYLKKGDVEKGLAAIDRALANGYGGRKLRLYSTKLDLLLAKKDLGAAKTTVQAARADLQRIHPSQVREGWKKEFEAKAKQVDELQTKS